MGKAMNEIRFLKVNDIEKLLKLWLEAGLSHRPKGRDSFQNLKRQLSEPNTRFIGYFHENNLIAAAIASHNGRKGWINRLAVTPKSRRKNIASDVIENCENWLKNQNIQIYAVLIEDYNQASMNLFKKHDYIRHDDIIYFTKRENKEI